MLRTSNCFQNLFWKQMRGWLEETARGEGSRQVLESCQSYWPEVGESLDGSQLQDVVPKGEMKNWFTSFAPLYDCLQELQLLAV